MPIGFTGLPLKHFKTSTMPTILPKRHLKFYGKMCKMYPPKKQNRICFRWRISELPEYGEYQENSYRQADLQTLLHNALNTLNELQKSAILLCDYEGYSYKEIGDILSLSESQVKIYIFRGRQKLQRYLVSIQKVI